MEKRGHKSLLSREDPPGLVILDPHGDLFRNVLALELFHPDDGRLRDRLTASIPATLNRRLSTSFNHQATPTPGR